MPALNNLHQPRFPRPHSSPSPAVPLTGHLLRPRHVFANAMTGNLVLLGYRRRHPNWVQVIRHAVPLILFLVGIFFALRLRDLKNNNASLIALLVRDCYARSSRCSTRELSQPDLLSEPSALSPHSRSRPFTTSARSAIALPSSLEIFVRPPVAFTTVSSHPILPLAITLVPWQSISA